MAVINVKSDTDCSHSFKYWQPEMGEVFEIA
jgi:hypothetical protein